MFVSFAAPLELDFPFVPMEWITFGLVGVLTLLLLLLASYVAFTKNTEFHSVPVGLALYGLGLIAAAVFYWVALFPLVISMQAWIAEPLQRFGATPLMISSGLVYVGAAFVVAAIITVAVRASITRRVDKVSATK